MRRSNGRGTEGKNDTVLVRDIGAKRKKRGVFSYGEVFFLLTCPLMGDPMPSALFSKGLRSACDQAAYRARMEAAPKSWRAMYEYGERRHCRAELAKEWILHGLPRYDIPYEYVLFKPLSRTAPEDNLRAVIFPVSPDELGGLVTLAGSVMPGTDPVQVPQGADCNSITAFAYAQAELSAPRAILGMLGVDGREVMHKRFRDDTLTLTLPAPLYHRMEQEANNSVLQTPSWKRLTGR